jgi:hypothetical protein
MAISENEGVGIHQIDPATLFSLFRTMRLFLFGYMKTQLRDRHFTNKNEVTSPVTQIMQTIPIDPFSRVFEKLIGRLRERIQWAASLTKHLAGDRLFLLIRRTPCRIDDTNLDLDRQNTLKIVKCQKCPFVLISETEPSIRKQRQECE